MPQTTTFGKHLADDADQHRCVDVYGDGSTVRRLVGEGQGDWDAVHRAEGTVERLAHVGVFGAAGGVVRASVEHGGYGVAGAFDGDHPRVGARKLG